jgi:hypothetical protein
LKKDCTEDFAFDANSGSRPPPRNWTLATHAKKPVWLCEIRVNAGAFWKRGVQKTKRRVPEARPDFE